MVKLTVVYYFLVLNAQHYIAYALSFAVMSYSLPCLCAWDAVPCRSCCCSLMSSSLSVHQSCHHWQHTVPYHELFTCSISAPLQFQQHMKHFTFVHISKLSNRNWTLGHLFTEWCMIHTYIFIDYRYKDRSWVKQSDSVGLAQARLNYWASVELLAYTCTCT